MYKWRYKTPVGFSNMLMVSDGEYLTNLCFIGSKDEIGLDLSGVEKESPIFQETSRWLDIYFGGREPNFKPKYKLKNLTPFRAQVSAIMTEIPFGKLTTYQKIAMKIAKQNGLRKMSAQAVGGAVGWNPLCLIIPCHRVIGSNGSLTGYGGGLSNKIALLKNEGVDVDEFKCVMEGV